MARIFGFEIKRTQEDDDKENILTFSEPLNDDGALTVGTALGGSYGMLLDLDEGARSEAELVTRYRQMTINPEIQQAVDEVVNEAISIDSHEKVVEIILDDVEQPDRVKEKITEAFDDVLSLLDFSNNAYEIFSKFYVDGRLNYHAIIDTNNLKRGLVELRYVDPRKIKLIRQVETTTDKATRANVKTVKGEYYMYNENGFGSNGVKVATGNDSVVGLQIAKDSIVRVTSGLLTENNSIVLSHLHRAIKPLNQLRMLEDATVIYTITRAPERRVFYVDVGSLPKAKAEQYLHDMMARHKNRVVYDPTSGEVRDDRKMMTMTEDYWFPRREGNRSTEVETLPGGTGLGDNENLTYFQKRLYKALNVPVARLEPEAMYTFGRGSEVTREELKFSKFVRRARTRFSILFDKCLEKQLILKGVIEPGEWKDIQNSIRYDFMKDNYFEELKQAEILKEKMATLREVEEHVGTYYSRAWVRKNILFLSDDDIKEMDKEMAKEKSAEEEISDDDTDSENGFGNEETKETPTPNSGTEKELFIKNKE